MKHVYRWTDLTYLLYIPCMHFVQRMDNNLVTVAHYKQSMCVSMWPQQLSEL